MRLDLYLALIGFWGASIASYAPTSGNHTSLMEYPICSTVQTDLCDWASLVFELMTGSQPMEQFDGYEEDDEFFQEVERRVQQNDFPSLEEAKMGVIVGKCWKGEYRSTLEVMVDVKGFIEEREMKVVMKTWPILIVLVLGSCLWRLKLCSEGFDKFKGKNGLFG